ncbi:hypothetical protein EMIT0158MI4_100149 [Burkholderia ambifaria]
MLTDAGTGGGGGVRGGGRRSYWFSESMSAVSISCL